MNNEVASGYRILVNSIVGSHHMSPEGHWHIHFDVIEPTGKPSNVSAFLAKTKHEPAKFPILPDGEDDPIAPVVFLTGVSDHFVFDTDYVSLGYTVTGTDGVTKERSILFDRGTKAACELDLS